MTEYIVKWDGAGKRKKNEVFTPDNVESGLISTWLAEAAITEYTAPDPVALPPQLGPDAYDLNFTLWDVTDGGPPFSLGGTPFLAPLAPGGNVYLEEFAIISSVASTNTPSHYWTVSLFLLGVGEPLATLSTSADTHDVATVHSTKTFTNPVVLSTAKALVIGTDFGAGSPGLLQFAVRLKVRDIL